MLSYCFVFVYHAIVYYKHSHWNHPFESRSQVSLLSHNSLVPAFLWHSCQSQPLSQLTVNLHNLTFNSSFALSTCLTNFIFHSLHFPPYAVSPTLAVCCYSHSQACSSRKTFPLVVFPIGKLIPHHLQWSSATF